MDEIAKALHAATTMFPYYARGFAALTPIEKVIDVGGGPTLGVDKYWRLYWSPEALKEFKYHEAQVLCHELEHLLREHAERRKKRVDARAWNVACDAEINDDIEGLPDSVITPERIEQAEGLTAEEYYSNFKVINISVGGTEGSGVTGTPEDWEESPENSDAPSISDVESDILRDAIAQDIQEAVSKNPGSVPEGVRLWAEARALGKLPKISWRKLVSNRLRRIIHGATDWTYVKPSRRQDRGSRCLLPGKMAYQPQLAVVLDTSGSMQDQADWVAGILKDLSKMKADIILIDCDAAVHRINKLNHWKDILKSRGGGGTDMREGVAAARKLKPDLTLILTDGYTPWPEPWPTKTLALVHENEHAKVKVFRG